MSDDLDNFFAKKKGKKTLSQDTDSLARKLEKAVKQQEQIDRVRDEEERINKERIQAVESQQHAEVLLVFMFLSMNFIVKLWFYYNT